MKHDFNTIAEIFNERPEFACVKNDQQELIEKIETLSKRPFTEMVTGIADLYARHNPNMYAPGNNSRLYTQPDSVAVIGAFIALLGNNSGGTDSSNPIGSIVAQKVFDFFIKDVVGYIKGEAIDTSGGTAANEMAIHLARFYFDKQTKNEGNGNMKFVLLTSDQSHYSLEGGVNRAGLGIDTISYIKTHPDGTMNVDDLEHALDYYVKNQYHVIVVSTLGTTVLGALDNINEIADMCYSYKQQHGKIWHHCDASWGGPITVSRYAELAVGLNKTDSVALDTHKAFKSTLTCGIIVTCHVGLLTAANFSRGGKKYLYHNNMKNIDNGMKGFECGKPDRTLPFGMMLMTYGKIGLSTIINRDVARARVFSEIISECEDIVVVHNPQYLNVCIQVVSPMKNISNSEFTQKIHTYILNQDSSYTMIELCKDTKSNTFVLRCILSNSSIDSNAMHSMISEIITIKEIVRNQI